MGDKAIKDLLSANAIAGMIEEIKGGLPDEQLPASVMNVTRRIKGNVVDYMLVEGTQKLATQVMYGSPSVARKLKGVSTRTVSLIHTFENYLHNMAVMENLRSYTNYSQQNMGRQEIGRQVKDFILLFSNLRKAAVFCALALGHIYFDGEGNLLPSSSGNVIDVDFSVPAANQSQCAIEGTDILDASWATASTKIHKHVRSIITAIKRKTGYTIKNAFYGANTLDNMLANTKLKELINRNTAYQTAASKNEIAKGFLGLDWYPFDLTFFQDQDGTNQTISTADHVIFTPAFDSTWWEVIEGSFPVPNKLSIGNDALSAVGDFTDRNGMFSYAEIQTDPPSIKHMAGDTFLPIIKVPGAVVIADTEF